MKRLLLFVACSLAMTLPAVAASPSDVQDRIRALEQQLETLRELKANQDRAQSLREKQCYQVFPSRSFCSCLAARLPAEMSFEQYVSKVTEGPQQDKAMTAIRDACAGPIP
jgi:ABC-type transporter MlaC component